MASSATRVQKRVQPLMGHITLDSHAQILITFSKSYFHRGTENRLEGGSFTRGLPHNTNFYRC